MTTMHCSPRLARLVYRSLLRFSNHGSLPQIFGQLGAAVFAAQQDERAALAVPDSAARVKQRMKEWFRNPTTLSSRQLSADFAAPLTALQYVRSNHDAMFAATSDVLPIFDYSGVAALPGETIQFALVQPRSLELAQRVIESDSQQFLLRSHTTSTTATLLTLRSHVALPNTGVVARQGGPRIRIVDQIEEVIPGELHPEVAKRYNLDPTKLDSTLISATSYQACRDAVTFSDDASFGDVRQNILNHLQCSLPFQKSDLTTTFFHFGLPPLQAEEFSYWALRYVLAPDNVASRLTWLHDCHSTPHRLAHIVREVNDVLKYHYKQQQQQQHRDNDDDLDELEERRVA